MDRPFSLFPRIKAPRVGIVSDTALYIFLAFQLVDQIVLSILVVTFLVSKSCKRHPTLINACATFTVTGIVSSLLLYTGTHVGPEPPKMLCITQAALMDGIPPMNSVAVLALMYQAYLSIRKSKGNPRKASTYALLIIPWLTFFCFAMTAALLAVDHPNAVTRGRRFFYCSFKSKVFSNIFALFTAVMLLATTGYELAIGLFLYKNWRVLRQSGNLDIQTVSRVIVFGTYVFLAMVLSVLSIIAPRSPLPDLFAASVGPVLALCIGTQADIYRAWFRRPVRTAPQAITADWVSVDTETFRMESGGEKVPEFGIYPHKDDDAKYEYVVASPTGHDRVLDISVRFRDDSRHRPPLDEDDLTVDPDAKEVDVVSGRHGYF